MEYLQSAIKKYEIGYELVQWCTYFCSIVDDFFSGHNTSSVASLSNDAVVHRQRHLLSHEGIESNKL
jgi:hypothetical protein